MTFQAVIFSVLVPILKSRGATPDNILENFHRLSDSLVRSIRKESQYKIVVYVAVDPEVDILLGSFKSIESILRKETDFEIVVVDCGQSRSLWKMWEMCAQKAFEDGCHFMVLLRDNIELQVEGWVEAAHDAFKELSHSSGTMFGFGSVSFHDTSFPGIATVPVIHRTHMEVFKQHIVPDGVEADVEFFFQLYRRFGCSKVLPCQISKAFDADVAARSDGQLSEERWSFETLDKAVRISEVWLRSNSYELEKVVTLDVVVPSYRVIIPLLQGILDLGSSKSCSVLFMVIIDNPKALEISELRMRYAHRPDVRILVNETNLGAPATRNRGFEESAADWIHFLDDDLVPDQDILLQVEKVIREHPNAPGFVGNSRFPCADSIATTALHIAGVTHFWSVATRIPSNVPWGVGANLISRRNGRDGIRFSLLYPKTGGGEDIDFGISNRVYALRHGKEGLMAAPDVKIVHPWWNNGNRCWHRFYMWSFGDGHLLQRFPQYTYIDFTPSAAESLVLCFICGLVASLFAQWRFVLIALKAAFSIMLGNVIHDCYRHLYLHPERLKHLNTSLTGLRWFAAVVESACIRMYRDMGWLHWVFEFGGYKYIGLRFDLTAGRLGEGPVRVEKKNRLQKTVISALLTIIFVNGLYSK